MPVMTGPPCVKKALNFGEAEQALLTGHAFHPAPKSHEPFNRREAERYLPDMAPHFPTAVVFGG